MRLLSFGEVLWDVYPDKACIGGAPLNVAAHAAVHGESAAMLSAVGDDDLGKDTLARLQAWHIDTAHVAVLSSIPTGKCVVTLDQNGVPSYDLLDNVAWDHIGASGVTTDFDVLYFGTLALRHAHNLHTLCALLNTASFQEVFADVNIRAPFYTADTVRFAFEHATIIKISDEELPVVLAALDLPDAADDESLLKALSARFNNLRVILLTKGGEGAVAYDTRQNEVVRTPAVKAAVISTVGAGDSFSAAFLHRYMAHDPLDTCLRYAATVASLVVSHYDAVPNYTPPKNF